MYKTGLNFERWETFGPRYFGRGNLGFTFLIDFYCPRSFLTLYNSCAKLGVVKSRKYSRQKDFNKGLVQF